MFWYDGLQGDAQIRGVPDGELLGDLPLEIRAPRNGSEASPPPPPTGSSADVFDCDKFQALKKTPTRDVPLPDGSLFIGDKGMLTTGTYGEDTRLVPVEKMKDTEFPQPC